MKTQCVAGKVRSGRRLGLGCVGAAIFTMALLLGLSGVSLLRAQPRQADRAQTPSAAGAQAQQGAGQTSTAGTGTAGAAGDASLPSFEVASIKVHVPDASGRMFINMGCGQDPGRCAPSNVTAKMLIDLAYNLKDFQVLGGPGWLNSERFDVEAKVDDATAEQLQKLPRAQQMDQMRLMLRSLLIDRFKLKATPATKEVPVYALVVAKGGPRLTEVPPPDPQSNPAPPRPAAPGGPLPPMPPGAMRMMMNDGQLTLTAKASGLASLVNMLSQQVGREVIDQTGLKGTYDYTLQFTSDTGLMGGAMPPGPVGGDASDAGGSSIFTAIQDQLGLKLETTKAQVDTITVEHIEEPSPN